MAVPSTKWLELNVQQYHFHVNIRLATLYTTHGRTSEPEHAPTVPRTAWATFSESNYADTEANPPEQMTPFPSQLATS